MTGTLCRVKKDVKIKNGRWNLTLVTCTKRLFFCSYWMHTGKVLTEIVLLPCLILSLGMFEFSA